MAASLSYADAVKLLGGTDSHLVSALDRLTGGVLLTASSGGSALALSLFDAKGELARLSADLVMGLSDRVRGLRRFDRTQRLVAAHQVIRLTAFFEAVNGVELPFLSAELGLERLDRAGAVELATGDRPPSARLRSIVEILTERTTAADGAGRRNGRSTAEEARHYFASLSERLLLYLQDLPVWDRLDDPARARLEQVIQEQVGNAALRGYEEFLRRLAGEFPEVAFWINRDEHAATRDEVAQLHNGLEGLGDVLASIASGRRPDPRRAELAKRYRRVLDRPITGADDAPDGVVVPALADAYINPRFRTAAVTRSDRLDQEQWWADRLVRDDLQQFLIAHLTSLEATERPLIVLGQPGSGKSMLTRILAARLPPSDFLAVRVVLRDVPADDDLQAQIEHALRDATGDGTHWSTLARSAGAAMPVILLDGLDELLQATGVGQTNYLDQVVRFQEREADQERPVAVIVTSRTAVAARAPVPTTGARAVKLEPFSGEQVTAWLQVWNEHNTTGLAARGLLPLQPELALRHGGLASQPLLLLMLVLYDATDNALQRQVGQLDEADLYERILVRFAERELRREHPDLDGHPLHDAAEDELHHLSVAAFAMFNRGRQWVTENELTHDLAVLVGDKTHMPRPGVRRGFSASTAGQRLIGRFYFIHQARASRGDDRLATYEFLHATFGEFLIARLICRELARVVATTAHARSPGRLVSEDGFLRAMLSFATLTSRAKVVEFLAALVKRLPPDHHPVLRTVLLVAFQGGLEPGTDRRFDRYRPVHRGVPAEHAAYTANLLLLVLLVGSPVAGSELFPRASVPVAEWRRHVLLWRSQFTGADWAGLAATLHLTREWHEGEREIAVRLRGNDRPATPPPDGFWMHIIPPDHEWREFAGWERVSVEALRHESHLTCDDAEDVLWHGLAPVIDHIDTAVEGGSATTAFGVLSAEEAVSTTRSLLGVWIASTERGDADELERAYRQCLTVISRSRPIGDPSTKSLYSRVLRQMAADRPRLSTEFLRWAQGQTRARLSDPEQEAIADSLAAAFGDLDDSPEGS